jgi:hypothetical protein
VRRHFHLESGSLLDLEIARDAIVLRPQAREATLVEENGLLVHEGEPTGGVFRDTVRIGSRCATPPNGFPQCGLRCRSRKLVRIAG